MNEDPNPGKTRRPLSSNRILLVEGDRLRRSLHSAMLAIAGFETYCVADGAKALDVIARVPVDLVIAQRTMPGIDGCELVRVLRARGSRVPVVVVCGSLVDRSFPEELQAEIAEVLPETATTREFIAASNRALYWNQPACGLAKYAADCSPAFGF